MTGTSQPSGSALVFALIIGLIALCAIVHTLWDEFPRVLLVSRTCDS